MPETRKFEGELSGDWFVIVVSLGDRDPHARIYVRTEEDVRTMLARLNEVGK